MDDKRRRELLDINKDLTLEGGSVGVVEWNEDYVTLIAQFGGYWQVPWETFERVINGDGNFKAEDVTLTHMLYKGIGKEIPEPIKERFNLA